MLRFPERNVRTEDASPNVDHGARMRPGVMRTLAVLCVVCVAAHARPPAKPVKPRVPTALELLVGARPSTAPLLSRAPFGTVASDLAAKLPAYDRGLGMASLRDASIIPRLADGTLVGYWINGLDHKATPAALAKLRAAWGEPEAGHNDIGPTYVWVDPDARVHLWMQVVRTSNRRDYSNLFLEPYSPLKDLVGDRPAPLAFGGSRLLGATTAQLAAAYGARFRNNRIELGATEYTHALDVELRFANERVVGVVVHFAHGGNQRVKAAGDRIVTAVLGTTPAAPTLERGGTPQTYALAGGASARLYAYASSWTLDVE